MDDSYSPEVLALEQLTPNQLCALYATNPARFGPLCDECCAHVACFHKGQMTVSPGDLYTKLPSLLQAYRGDGRLTKYMEAVVRSMCRRELNPPWYRVRTTLSDPLNWSDIRPQANQEKAYIQDNTLIPDLATDVEADAIDGLKPDPFDPDGPLMRYLIRPAHAYDDRLALVLFIARCFWRMSFEEITARFHVSQAEAQALIDNLKKRLRRFLRRNEEGE